MKNHDQSLFEVRNEEFYIHNFICILYYAYWGFSGWFKGTNVRKVCLWFPPIFTYCTKEKVPSWLLLGTLCYHLFYRINESVGPKHIPCQLPEQTEFFPLNPHLSKNRQKAVALYHAFISILFLIKYSNSKHWVNIYIKTHNNK